MPVFTTRTATGHSNALIRTAEHVIVQEETVTIPDFSYGLTPIGMTGWDPNTLYPTATLRQIDVFADMETNWHWTGTVGGGDIEYWYAHPPESGQELARHQLNLYRPNGSLLVQNSVIMPPKHETVPVGPLDVHIFNNVAARFLKTIVNPNDLAMFTHNGGVQMLYNRLFLNPYVTSGGDLSGDSEVDYGTCTFTFRFTATY